MVFGCFEELFLFFVLEVELWFELFLEFSGELLEFELMELCLDFLVCCLNSWLCGDKWEGMEVFFKGEVGCRDIFLGFDGEIGDVKLGNGWLLGKIGNEVLSGG